MIKRLICLLTGYAFGNILTADLVSCHVSGDSVFHRGTGNPGMANVAALDGAKCGAIVLAGDLAKTFLPCLLCRMLLFPNLGAMAAVYAGLGAVLGHNFPCWHRFQGGKEVSCTCVAIVSISFGYGLLACIIGLAGVLISHYLPVGAVLIPLAFLIPAFCIYGKEAGIIAIILTIIMIQRHLPGLKNIPSGTEPRKDLLKKLKK